MNNYVLITKRTENSGHVIDSATDDLKVLSERMESLKSKGYLEAKIFQLANLASGKEYINDQIEMTARSMSKYQFYPIYRIRTTIKGFDKITATSYYMAKDLIPSKDEFKKAIDIMNDCIIDILTKCKLDRLIKSFEVNSDLLDHKYRLVGMDSWLVDPIGGYYTNSKASDDELMKSFDDYISRHKSSIISSDENNDNESLTLMDFSKFINKRAEDFPICEKYITKYENIKLEKFNKLFRININE